MRPVLKKNIFRAYDIRGLVGDEVHTDLAYNIGRALAHFWSTQSATKHLNKKLAVGFDAQKSSPELAHALMEGFALSKWQVVSLGISPTPLVYFSTVTSSYPFGVVITGSHNPIEFNGFKMSCRGDSLSSEDIQSLYKWLVNHWIPYQSSNCNFELFPAYKEYVTDLVEKYKVASTSDKEPLKIVVDSGNGAAGLLSSQIYNETGHTIIPMYDDPDGNFPNHHPDPSETVNLKDIINRVKQEDADFGIAFDGDGDRIGVILKDGGMVYGDQLLTLYAQDILSRKPGAKIITEVKASQAFFDKIIELGGTPIMWRTGHSLIKKKIKEVQAELAGEMSGHIFFSDGYYGYDDAIYAGLRLILWAEKPQNSLSKFIESLPKYISTPEIRVDCPDQEKFEVVKKVQEYFSKEYEVNTIDGARIDFPNMGWGLVRASNTQPVLVLRFEGNTPDNLQKIESTVRKKLSTYGY